MHGRPDMHGGDMHSWPGMVGQTCMVGHWPDMHGGPDMHDGPDMDSGPDINGGPRPGFSDAGTGRDFSDSGPWYLTSSGAGVPFQRNKRIQSNAYAHMRDPL